MKIRSTQRFDRFATHMPKGTAIIQDNTTAVAVSKIVFRALANNSPRTGVLYAIE
jgi:hypothetical protein